MSTSDSVADAAGEGPGHRASGRSPGNRHGHAVGVAEALAILDEGALPAIAIDPRERVVRAVNGTLAERLDLEPGELDDETVQAIVAEEHHILVETILDALAAGANLGPTRVRLRPPRAESPRASIWARLPGAHEILGSTLVLLCHPYRLEAEAPGHETGDAGGPEDPKDVDEAEAHPGYGRIPPFRRIFD